MQTYIFGIKLPSKRQWTALAYTLLFAIAIIHAGHVDHELLMAGMIH